MSTAKYRAWNKLTKEWITDPIIDGENGKVMGFSLLDGSFQRHYSGDEIVLVQYTGLKDRYGVFIYERDIVKVTHDDGTETIGQVEWGLTSKGFGTYPAFAIYEFESEMNSFSEIFDTGHYTIEVIGNIYENKELIK